MAKDNEATEDQIVVFPGCPADDELKHLVRARFPLIYVVTWEETRVIRSLEKICNDINLSGVQIWDAGRGLIAKTERGEMYSPIDNGEELKDPDEVLEHITKKAEENKSKKLIQKSARGPIYVLCDLYRYLEDPKADTERKLKNLASVLKKSTITVVITSPELQLPLSLEKVVTVLDYPLPGPEQLIVLLNSARNKLVLIKKMTVENSTAVPDENIIKALLGLTLQEAEDALSKAFVITGKFDTNVLCDLKRQVIRKGQILDYVYSEENISHIGGLAGVKRWIKTRKSSFTDKARTYPLRYPKGVFLLGLQGTGKSLCAKVIANELGIPLLKLDLGKVFAPHIGESEGNIRRALKQAESIAPCVLFVDEIDMALSGSSSNSNNDSGVSSRVLMTIMDWLQERKAPVFLVACANSMNLPPAILRKGRFDERFFVDLPDDEERDAIFKIHLKKRLRDPSKFDLDKAVGSTKNFSGAEIEAVIEDAMTEAFADGCREVTTKDIMDQIVVAFPLAKTMKEALDDLRERARERMRSANELSVNELVGDQDDIRALNQFGL
jgi:ATP-dependent 26S proteasome regulatory subunit